MRLVLSAEDDGREVTKVVGIEDGTGSSERGCLLALEKPTAAAISTTTRTPAAKTAGVLLRRLEGAGPAASNGLAGSVGANGSPAGSAPIG
jgi:predicted RNase H-like nuclease